VRATGSAAAASAAAPAALASTTMRVVDAAVRAYAWSSPASIAEASRPNALVASGTASTA